MAAVAKAMASPESGLEVRDRMWLKITIPNAFIGKLADSLWHGVETPHKLVLIMNSSHFSSLSVSIQWCLLKKKCAYSFFGLLKHDFQNRARVFKTLHTISTTTHPINKTLQILCIIKHSNVKTIHFCLKTTLCYHMKHTFHIYYTLFARVTLCCDKPKTLLALLLPYD